MFRLTVALAAVFTVLALAGVASADSPHFKKGSPSAVTDNGNLLTFSQTASVAGLGNGDIVVTLGITNVQPTASCVNPAGQTQPPGQNPVATNVSGSVAVPGPDIKNGTLTITVSTAPPTSPIVPNSCPNPNWTEPITDMSLTASSVATLTFYSDLDHSGTLTAGDVQILQAMTP